MTSGPGLRSAYAQAGVDVEAGEQVVELLKDRLGARHAADGGALLTGIGAFASAVALPPGYREPVLVSATDGVGTKTAIASAMRRHDTIGRDLVAMCADDVVCTGAEPLFFLDYVAVGRVVPDRVATIVEGIARGCRIAGCALLGGETAEHPGVMADDAFDLAGFCVGVVEAEDRLWPERVHVGDVVVGLPSSGLHANGFSLVRQVVDGDDLDEPRPELGRSLADELLEPCRIYAGDVLRLVRDRLVRSAAHITGGGFLENIPRALPSGLGARIRRGAWAEPPIFELIRRRADLTEDDLFGTFNMGIGMVLVIDPELVDHVLEQTEGAVTIGEVVEGPGVRVL
jgi:phosphoribosylformylglycinamidine cyclo-ligase